MGLCLDNSPLLVNKMEKVVGISRRATPSIAIAKIPGPVSLWPGFWPCHLALWGVPGRLYPPASVQHCTGQPCPGHEYYELGMTRGVYVGNTILQSTSRKQDTWSGIAMARLLAMLYRVLLALLSGRCQQG